MTPAATNPMRGTERWQLACQALRVLSVDPAGVGGAVLRGPADPARELWLDGLHRALPDDRPWRRMPASITDDRLLGGLDLAATLRVGRPVVQSGLLQEANGGVLLVAMAERLEPRVAATLATALDQGVVQLQRDGFAHQVPARLGCVALDEGHGEEESVPPLLAQRLPLYIDLTGLRSDEIDEPSIDQSGLALARQLLPQVQLPAEMAESLCAVALALGIESLRIALLAARVARVSAALGGRTAVAAADAQLAAALVLAPRATCLPAPPSQETAPPDPPPTEAAQDPPPAPTTEQPPTPQEPQAPLQEQVLAAAAAALPPGLLLQLLTRGANTVRQASTGRSGALQASRRRGRPAGVRQGLPRAGQRLSVIDTLRAAAPWQVLRRPAASAPDATRRIQVRSEDFQVRRYRQRRQTATVFVIDASGSAALHRLAEAKGAVELLLAECYVRRDQVAVIAFRGRDAQLLLPPTRSLVRARRSLAGLPGGGGTPLAAGIESALAVGQGLQRSGLTPTLVLLTDGRANVTRAGMGQREQATAEALTAARRLAAAGLRALVIDTGPRPQPQAAQLAQAAAAIYLPLPQADARSLARAVQTTRSLTQGAA